MTGNSWLDWVILSVSLFNTMLLVWLGLTVLLNAERRNWGVWLAGFGVLAGAAFFISHSALVAQPLFPFTATTNFWWHAGWGPIILAPFAWYVMVLWYAGYWDDPKSALYRRQRFWLVATILAAVLLTALLLYGNPLPTLAGEEYTVEPSPSLGGIPLLILGFPVFIFMCIGSSFDALLRPGPSGRFMGDHARRRARPWLVATSLTLLLVSLLVAWVLLRLSGSISGRAVHSLTEDLYFLAWADLGIESLISLAILLLGEAIVSYEIFTGRTLPRGGFLRQWHNAVILSVDVSVVVAAALAFHLPPANALLLTMLLLTVFYALFSWRSHSEREQLAGKLRPLVTGQRMYEQLLDGDALDPATFQSPFTVLCRDVIETRQAVLVALGPLAPLAGQPLLYPPDLEIDMPDLGDVTRQFQSPQMLGLPLNPHTLAGFAWAVPLWSERGLVGVLLLGEKTDNGYYTQEQIEIARASGERLVDNRAVAEIASRLMAIQRQRMVESQVLDRQTRRVLHDDVLPELHAAILTLSEAAGEPGVADAQNAISQAHRRISDLLHDIPPSSLLELSRLGLIGTLRELMEGEMAGAFDQVVWQVEPDCEKQLRSLPVLSIQVLYYALRESIRNAARHARRGQEDQPLRLTLGAHWQDGPLLWVEDNGAGISALPIEDRVTGGKGLALHSTMLAVVGGSLAVESQPGKFTRLVLSIPSSSLSGQDANNVTES